MPHLMIAHGSKHPEHAAAFERLLKRYHQLHPEPQLDYGFLNYCTPNAEERLLQLAKTNNNITLIPLFLGKASHVLEDIPNLIKAVQHACPSCRIQQTEVLGFSNELAPALESELQNLNHTKPFELPDTELLLLGRGSSVKSSLQFMHDLKDRLTLPFKNIRVAFWDIAHPSFDQAQKDFLTSASTHLLVQPLFLFPGILHDKCLQKLETNFKTHTHKQFILGQPLCYWKNLTEMIHQRITSTRSFQ
jgi:sirohydrochlorin cobaltochelatase